MIFTDTHAHLADFAADSSLDSVVERALRAGVGRIITCSTTPSDWVLYQKLCEKFSGVLYWQIGIHPTELKPGDDLALEALGSFLIGSGPAPVAVGEIGMDFYRLPTDPDEAVRIKLLQEDIFRKQLALAKDFGLPVCVHARNAVRECIDAMASENFDFSRAVFHCFSGNRAELSELVEKGARASFTGVITYKNAGEMRENMLEQGLSKIMFETDCPYLAPIPLRGKRNEPSTIPITAEFAAGLFGVGAAEMAEISSRNASEFFGLQPVQQ